VRVSYKGYFVNQNMEIIFMNISILSAIYFGVTVFIVSYINDRLGLYQGYFYIPLIISEALIAEFLIKLHCIYIRKKDNEYTMSFSNAPSFTAIVLGLILSFFLNASFYQYIVIIMSFIFILNIASRTNRERFN